MDDTEKIQSGLHAFHDFFQQFGDDVYARILIEVIMEGIINAETLFIFGEQEEEGNQIDHSATGNPIC
jgi:hypothetical protein